MTTGREAGWSRFKKRAASANCAVPQLDRFSSSISSDFGSDSSSEDVSARVMSRVYDNWERLVGATLKREQLRQLALCPSFSSATSSDFSFDPSFEDVFETIDYAARSSLINPSYYGLRSISYKEIQKATRNFRRDLYIGEGAFGIVCKGWIREDDLTAAQRCMWAFSRSGTAVAIKEWNHMLGSQTWLMELKYLGQLHHPNVVKLIGYCSEGDNLVSVYEFLRKGSLKNHLITRGHQSLSWNTRIKVAIGVARGLSFLQDREMPVIHRNINVDNILLDADFNAKLASFFLAEDGPISDTSHASTRVMGTSRFAAPEHLASGHLMAKCNVYAFGVVLLQILSGREFSDLRRVKPSMNGEIKLSQIMDTKLNGEYPRNGALAVVRLAFQCLNSDPELRPRMDEVLLALEKL